MQALTNRNNISMAMAVFLATDNYDYNPDPMTISATSLIKPIRELVLSERVKPQDTVVDISSRIASAYGSALHDAIERAWVNNYENALTALGYSKDIIDRIVINPPLDLHLPDDAFPVYLEQRRHRKLDDFTVSGKFDFIAEGEVKDFKSTNVYTYIHQTKEEDYRLQGSIYRWLCPDLITSDYIEINYLFKNFEAFKRSTPNYPPAQVTTQRFPLLSLADTERYIRGKLQLISQYRDADQEEIPECTPKQLWQRESQWLWYSKPENVKPQRNFKEDKQAALIHFSEKGGTGLIKERPGDVMACNFCNANSICSQREQLAANGLLKVL